MPKSLCYVFTAPSGADWKRFWRMAQVERLPARTITERGAEGEAVSETGERASVITLWQVEPPTARPAVRPWEKPGDNLAVKVQDIPAHDIYVAVGREATLALVSGRLSQRYQGLDCHASSVVRSPMGVCALPADSVVVPVAMPGFIPEENSAKQIALFGNEEWYPSQRLALQRVRALLDGVLPAAPPHSFTLYAGAAHFGELREAALAASGVSIDLETPWGADSIYIGAFSVGSRTWVFESEDMVRAARRLFAEPSVGVYGQNLTTFDMPILMEHDVMWPLGAVRDSRWMDSKLRPRMPHDLASIAAHTLPWAPQNWKPMGEATPLSEQHRRYCAVDAANTWWICKQQEEDFKDA